MKEYKGRVFATSNNPNDDEYGKFIFRWDDITDCWFGNEKEYNEDNWQEYGCLAKGNGYIRYQEGDWIVIDFRKDINERQLGK